MTDAPAGQAVAGDTDESMVRIIPWIVACALLMQNLDSTAVTTAVPVMARSLGVAPIKLSAAVTSYVLAVALHISQIVHDTSSLHPLDFARAFIVIGLASWASGIAFSRLGHDVGTEMSGHAARPR